MKTDTPEIIDIALVEAHGPVEQVGAEINMFVR